jgi:hypothetical protein
MRYMIGAEEHHAIEIEVTGGDDCVSPLVSSATNGAFTL